MAARHCRGVAFLILGFALAGPVRAGDPIREPLWRFGPLGIPEDSIVTQAGRYHSIALSLIGPNSSVGAIFDELGSPDDTRWRLGHYLPLSASYASVGAGLASISRGLGYWLITRDPSTIRFSGSPAPSDTFEIPLDRGPGGEQPAWNQVGNPFNFAVSPLGMAVTKRDSIVPLGAGNNPFTETAAKLWNPAIDGYQNATFNIAPNTGFWVKVKDRDTTSRWTRWDLETNFIFDSGRAIDLALDRNGSPHIVYARDSGARYARRHGRTWSFEPIAPFGNDFQRCSIVLDESNTPRVAFNGTEPNTQSTGLVYADRLGGGWNTVLVDGSYSAGIYSSIALNAAGQPFIAYNADDYSYLRFAERVSGSWVNAVVDSQWTFDCELALDANGAPHIAYVGYTRPSFETVLRYARRQGGNWIKEPIFIGPGFGIAFALDRTGVPNIVFKGEDGALSLARKNASTWTVDTIPGGSQGFRPSITFDGQNNAMVTFHDQGTPRLVMVRRNGTAWLPIEYIEVAPNAGSNGSSLALAPDGHPTVAYIGGSGSVVLKFAERSFGRVSLLIPPSPAAAPSLAAGTIEEKPEGALWTLEITARNGSRTAEPLVIGVAPGAEGIPNHARLGRAPAPPGLTGTTLVARGRNADGTTEELTRELRSPSERMAWTLSLGGGSEAGEAELSFRATDVPSDVKFLLRDELHGWQGLVVPGETMRLAFGAAPRSLVIEAVRGAVAPAAPRTGCRAVTPNPFREQSGLVFVLDEPSPIRVEILDLQGRRVRILERAAARPGEHVVVWNGRDQNERAVPPGVYLARWSTLSKTGAVRLVRMK